MTSHLVDGGHPNCLIRAAQRAKQDFGYAPSSYRLTPVRAEASSAVSIEEHLRINAIGSIFRLNHRPGLTPQIIEPIHVQSMKRNQLSLSILSNACSPPNVAMEDL
ncbi:hypothetical protein ABIF38_008767 [Bradyrhizobium japonicum]|uniref:hypothetical protein n=1 Tax=Bradyrhizobium elkanii TaxID=29448 RepID=UPI001144187D|nr:hypothetical protein [Bradyrhizobium elkanii]MCP1728916.1 hypothetical protein [Bradyrhizobium elkanii]MCS3573041.1 hypothetical protein [Bradyrhizobium elkanii]MCS3594266.1 hypothetical protein [Bradyrhizobium elkanii]MCS3623709.1 hypothetical protein [Bradyrhizobium elkanii]UQD79905.1 hypothetical protein JEY66_34380 [Bradyrhizobium elkanii USDA 76]